MTTWLEAGLKWLARRALDLAADYDDESWESGLAQGKMTGDAAGYERGHREGRIEGVRDGDARGHKRGYDSGRSDGYKQGDQDGFDRGKTVLLINDKRDLTPTRPQADLALTNHWRWPITDAVKELIKADFAARLPSDELPTPSQWDMILSDQPSTYVIAGAGSGKSTSLVYRIIVLTQHLHVDINSISVITFTRDSRRDFIRKLVEAMSIWGKPMTEKAAEDVVRTFHSMILGFSNALPGGRYKAFEFYESEGKDKDRDNIFDTRLSPGQKVLLEECLDQIYAANEDFRRYMGTLYKASLAMRRGSVDDPQLAKKLEFLSMASKRDEALTDRVESDWMKVGHWPFPGIEAERQTVSIQGKPFLTNGRLPYSGTLIVLGSNSAYSKEENIPPTTRSIIDCLYDKRALLSVSDTLNVRWVETVNDAIDAVEKDRALDPSQKRAPRFDYQIEGELKPQPIVSAFVSAATFIENMAQEVCPAIGAMRLLPNSRDTEFFSALSIFWPVFEAHLQTRGLRTFNRMFADFSERNAVNLEFVPVGILQRMQHLMIDEFQDISPQVVSWVRASMTEIRRRRLNGSLMCVGDDWQSIYGWRGSSPHYFIKFEKEFPAHAHKKVILRDNFRSHQNIIDCAEATLGALKAKSGKPGGVASGPNSHHLDTVKVLARDEKVVASQVHHHYENESGSIKVLYRKKGEFDTVSQSVKSLIDKESKLPKNKRRLTAHTYHTSKGLQADTVVLLGDCSYDGTSPYKNEVYRIAGFKQSFDEAQAEEVLRLAYVAITRAHKTCYWFLQGSPGASRHLPPIAHYLDRNLPSS